MSTSLNKSALSPARRRLVELMQRVNFGRIDRLEVKGGEPVLEPMPAVTREHKFCGNNSPRPEAGRDCQLRNHVADLMRLLDAIGDGTITVLVFKHGQPFHAEVPA